MQRTSASGPLLSTLVCTLMLVLEQPVKHVAAKCVVITTAPVPLAAACTLAAGSTQLMQV